MNVSNSTFTNNNAAIAEERSTTTTGEDWRPHIDSTFTGNTATSGNGANDL